MYLPRLPYASSFYRSSFKRSATCVGVYFGNKLQGMSTEHTSGCVYKPAIAFSPVPQIPTKTTGTNSISRWTWKSVAVHRYYYYLLTTPPPGATGTLVLVCRNQSFITHYTLAYLASSSCYYHYYGLSFFGHLVEPVDVASTILLPIFG